MTGHRSSRRPSRLCLILAAALACAFGIAVTPPALAAAPQGIYCQSVGDTRQPVLLVHGFNSGPQTWKDESRNQLSRAGSATCIDVFDYAKRSTYWVTDSAIGPALATRITELSKASAAAGGPGKVIVVAHSMGGLATRCAASPSCNGGQPGVGDRIAELISFGTPNLGSYLVTTPEHVFASVLSARCRFSVLDPIGVCAQVQALGTSEASRAFRADSAELASLPQLAATVPVYGLAAQIELHSTFFGLNNADLGTGGDLIVLPDSALAKAHKLGSLGGSQTIDCGTFDITDWPRSTNTCWHSTETNDTRFLEAAAHQIGLVEDMRKAPALTSAQVLNASVPAGSCGDGQTTGWKQPVPIQLHNGAGTARYPDGSFAGSSIDQAKVLGFADIDGDGRKDVVLEFNCFGSTPEGCCAGRASHAMFIDVLAIDTRAGLRLIGPVIRAGDSLPGDQYGPAGRDIRSATLNGTTITTLEYIYYPEQYTSTQVGGRDPTALVSVRHVLRGGRWTTA